MGTHEMRLTDLEERMERMSSQALKSSNINGMIAFKTEGKYFLFIIYKCNPTHSEKDAYLLKNIVQLSPHAFPA